MSTNLAARTLAVSLRPVESLIPYARNARTHSDEQVAQIAASIKEFGWTNPVLLDGESGIVAGHGRVLAARKLGQTEVPCIELSGLTDVQRRAYILADNKLTLNGSWDGALLALELEDLGASGFEVDLLGFSEAELLALKPAEPPDGFSEFDEDIDTEHSCPKCGYRWSGKADASSD